MKLQSGMCACALVLVTLVLVVEATFDLQRLLDLDEEFKRQMDETEAESSDQWDELPFKRGVGTQKFIACFHPGLKTKCFCDRTKPKWSRNYFYYCRGSRRQGHLRPV